MKPDTSTYPYKIAGDSTKAPDQALIYDGTNALVPVIEYGAVVFEGAIGQLRAHGIGKNGSVTNRNNSFRIPYQDILNGGAGVKIRASLDSLKQKVRITALNEVCGEYDETISLTIERRNDAQYPGNTWDTWYEPIFVEFRCGCTETLCQKLEKLAREINKRGENMPVTALFSNVGNVPVVELESKTAGRGFRVKSSQGLRVTSVVPNVRTYFTAADVREWFGSTVPLLADGTKKLTCLEMWYWEDVPTTNANGVATSNPLNEIYTYERIKKHVMIFFDTTVANSLAAFNQLKTVLTGPNSYDRKIGSTVAEDTIVYPFTITRTDAGDAAALTTARTNYPTGVVSLDRSFYVDGKSYYTFRSTTAAAPAPVGGDVVAQGTAAQQNIPEAASICPAGESSLCVGCV